MSDFKLQGGRIDDLAAHMEALADTVEERHEAQAQATREELQAMQTERRKLSEGVAELSKKLGEQIDAQRREKMEAEAERKKGRNYREAARRSGTARPRRMERKRKRQRSKKYVARSELERHEIKGRAFILQGAYYPPAPVSGLHAVTTHIFSRYKPRRRLFIRRQPLTRGITVKAAQRPRTANRVCQNRKDPRPPSWTAPKRSNERSRGPFLTMRLFCPGLFCFSVFFTFLYIYIIIIESVYTRSAKAQQTHIKCRKAGN